MLQECQRGSSLARKLSLLVDLNNVEDPEGVQTGLDELR